MKIILMLNVLCLLATLGCREEDKEDGPKDSTGGDTQLVNQATAKFKECDLFVPDVDDQDSTIEDDYDRCAAKCVIAASCDELKDLRCSEQPDFENPLLACVFECPESPADGYACSDGAKIPHAALCDGDEDCADGADEKDCKGHVCADGEKLELESVACDGFADCADGSDEAECAGVCG